MFCTSKGKHHNDPLSLRTDSVSSCCSPALQSVPRLSDVGCIITAAVRLTTERHTTEQPEISSGRAPWKHHILTNKGESRNQRQHKFNLKSGEVLSPRSWLTHLFLSSPLCCDCPHLQHLFFLFFCFHSYFFPSLAACSSLFRAVCLQVNKDQPPCLRPQRSAQRTPELSSREGRNDQKSLQHAILFVMIDCLEVKRTNKNQEDLSQLKGQSTWITRTHFTDVNSNMCCMCII